MDHLVSGIDNLDTNELELASSYMVQCSEKLPNAAKLMEEQLTNISTQTATPIPTGSSSAVEPTIELQPTQPPPSSGGGTESSTPFECIGGCATLPDPSCVIKGNVNSKGEKIYHVPGGSFYDRTDIKPEEGDRWFCTAEEARNAGFRASER